MTGKKGVYVCYKDYGSEGCTEPEVVFENRLGALEWCHKNQDNSNATFKFVEIEQSNNEGES